MENIYFTYAAELANRMDPGAKISWRADHIYGCDTGYDACSGGFSWLHRKVFGKVISCHMCCVIHDFLYCLGAPRAYRREADKLLRDCAGAAGGWRRVRAWFMYFIVRLVAAPYWKE